MKSKGDRTVVAVVACLVVVILCCLCVILTGSVAWLSTFLTTPEPTPVPTEPLEPESPLPAPTEAEAAPLPALPPGHEADTLRVLHDTAVPIADPIALAVRFLGVKDPRQTLLEAVEPIPVGASKTFWADNMDTDEYFKVSAEMVYAGDYVYFWVQRGVDYELKDVESLVKEFERNAYPTNRAFFGSEWNPGVDGDPRLHILYATGLGEFIAGYYSSSDEYVPEVHEYSNVREMFYLSADNMRLDEDYTDALLAHEFHHLIHWYVDRNEDTWMNEGLSELAVLLNGYELGGFDYIYALDPDQTLTKWPSEPGTADAHYGQAFLFMAYFLDRFGQEATRALAANPADGMDSIDETLASLGITDPQTGEAMGADALFRDWAVAMLLQDDSVGDGRYAFHSYAYAPNLQVTEEFSDCPVRPQSRLVSQYGVDAIRFTCPGEHTLRFDGEETVSVVPANAHSGDFAFWSNRGDESNMTLTRAFDLSGVSGPISLDYWVWYDLEEDYDYAYVEISEDGGETWAILTTPSGTAEDPTGSSYGWAYNGLSGTPGLSKWIEESVDLSAYAGRKIQIRFEYVTDAAVNGEGLLVDDIRIDALGYEEGFESGDGGWEAAGFVRLFNALPQTYRVVVVEEGAETTVREVALDDRRQGEVQVNIGDYGPATLLVMGTARYSWQPAPYTFELSQ